jgi:hypothetical protein
VVDLLGMAARVDVVAEDDRRYRVDRAARVLVEGDDQPPVVAYSHQAQRSRCFFIQRSPVRMEQSCMLWHMFGLTNDTVGSLR